MRGFVGTSQAEDVYEAISEATSGLKKADLIILLAPFHTAEQAAAVLHEKYPAVPMIGTCGAAFPDAASEDGTITVAALAGVTVSCGIIHDIRRAPMAYVKEFEENLKGINPDPSNTICMEFTTGSEEKCITTAYSVLSRYNISLVGGSSDGVLTGEKHIVIYNGRIYNRSMAYAFIRNNAGKIKVFEENIYEKLSERAHIATLVDPSTKSLFRLDDIPAYEVYSEETGKDSAGITDNMIYNPLGRAIGGDIGIVSTKSLDMNGVMFNAKALFENDSIYIMKVGDYKNIHEEFLRQIKDNTNRISFIFSYDSPNRLRLFAEEGYFGEYTESMSSCACCASLITSNQQHDRQNCNQTLVCAVFE